MATQFHSNPQRFNRNHPCPVCGGYDNMPRGIGERCAGFLSSDGKYVHCSREEKAGGLEFNHVSCTYAHRAAGPCRCGVEHAPERLGDRPTVTAAYDYCAADGTKLFQVLRYSDKSFKQRRPDGAGGWTWKLGDAARVLYRLPELTARPTSVVCVVEGEKDVDALLGLGLLATCNPMGAGTGKWLPEHTRTLRSRHVAILGDCDAVGRAHAATIADALRGVAATVRIIDLAPDQEAGYDVSDWLAEGHARAELEALIKAVPPLVSQPINSKEPMPADRPAFNWRDHVRPLKSLMAKVFAPATFVVDGMIPSGSTLIAGAPKTGKSLLGWQMALAKARGAYCFGIKVAQSDVLYLLLEDSERLVQKRVRTMLERLDAPDGFDYSTVWPTLQDGGVDQLRDYLTEHPTCKTVFIDTFEPLRAADKSGSNAYRNDYGGLAPVTRLSHELSVDIIVIHHTSKAERSDVFATINGSYGLNGAVDNMAVLTRVRFGDEVVLSLSGRDLDEDLQLALAYDKDHYSHTVLGNAEEVGKTKLQQRIVEVLRRAVQPLQARDIADELDRANDSSLRHLLGKLVHAGVAAVVERGRYIFAKQQPGQRPTFGEEADVCEHGCSVRCDRCDQRDRRSGGDSVHVPSDMNYEQEETKTVDHNDHKITNLPAPCPGCGKRYTFRQAPTNPGIRLCSNCGTPEPLQLNPGDF